MSKQHVLDFIRRVNDDIELQNRVRTAAMDGLGGLIKVATEVGFKFTAHEFHIASIRRPKPVQPPDELSDADLNRVVGGGGQIDPTPKTAFDEILALIAGGENSQSSPSIDVETMKLKRMIDK